MNTSKNLKTTKTLIRITINVLAVLAFLISFWVLVNLPKTLQETRDSLRIQHVKNLDRLLSTYLSEFPDVIASECSPTNPCDSLDSGTPAGSQAVDGSGWLPIDLTKWQPEPLIDRLPRDPFNKGDFVIRYATDGRGGHEFDVKLEDRVNENRPEIDESHLKPGNSPTRYEVGNNLNLLPP